MFYRILDKENHDDLDPILEEDCVKMDFENEYDLFSHYFESFEYFFSSHVYIVPLFSVYRTLKIKSLELSREQIHIILKDRILNIFLNCLIYDKKNTLG